LREHPKIFAHWSTGGIANQLISSNINIFVFYPTLCQKDIKTVIMRLPLLLGDNAMPIGGQNLKKETTTILPLKMSQSMPLRKWMMKLQGD
jgi:hypothetical protein